MKRSIKLSTLLLGMIFLFAQCEKEPFTTLEDPDAVNSMDAVKTSEAECVVVQTLWAGAGQNNTENGSAAGAVTATVVGNMLYVEYSVNMSYYLTEAHLWVGKDKKKVPKNAAPGRFPFKKNLDFASGTTFEVNLTSLGINPGDPVYVAAHGVVVGGIEGVEGLTSLFPVDGTPINYMPVYFKNFPNPTSYFKSIVNDRVLEGTYEGWCVDSRTRINHGTSLNGTVYLSYNLPTGEDAIFQKQENIGMLNWLINYDFVGKESSSFGIFTFGDVQKAIWILLEETPNPNPAGGVGSFNMDRVNEIVAMAAEHSDFVPVCGQRVVFVVTVPNQQTTIFSYPVPCGGGNETVWAFGEYTFIELGIAKKWGWVFEVTCY